MNLSNGLLSVFSILEVNFSSRSLSICSKFLVNPVLAEIKVSVSVRNSVKSVVCYIASGSQVLISKQSLDYRNNYTYDRELSTSSMNGSFVFVAIFNSFTESRVASLVKDRSVSGHNAFKMK